MVDTRPCLPTLTPCISAHAIFFGHHHIIKPPRYMNTPLQGYHTHTALHLLVTFCFYSNLQDIQLTNNSQVIHSHTHHPQHSKLAADQGKWIM